MKASVNKESYALVEKMAYKFAYGNDSFKYEEFVSAGLEGLIKAVKTYNEDNMTQFSTYANTCIRNAMCSAQKKQDKFTLQQDENIILDSIDTLTEETPDENLEDIVRRAVLKINHHNKRNSEIFFLNIGLNGEKKMTYEELGRKFNLTDERARQICVNTRKQIKRNKMLLSLIYSYANIG